MLKGRKHISLASPASPASLGAHGKEAAAHSIVLSVFGNPPASAPSSRVHVSICGLQQSGPTWCRGNAGFVCRKFSDQN